MYVIAQLRVVNKASILFPLIFIYISDAIAMSKNIEKCFCFFFPDPYDDDLKVKTQRPRSADQPGVFQAQTGE